jgi:uncharacterized protein YcbK (DUF882 family)
MRNFKEKEFVMGGVNVFNLMCPTFLNKLDQLRDLVREPLIITSSYRSEEYNKAIGGSPKSQHLIGNAVDLSCTNSTLRHKIVMEATSLGLSVGINDTFVHVDNRDKPILFLY